MNILDELDIFYDHYCGEKGIIGYSRLNKPIYRFSLRKTFYPTVIVQCAMHAREYITTYLCLKLIERFNLFGKVGTVHFIPAVNPDGIEIALTKKPLYKANFAGVDLNVNFDAKWGKGEKNLFKKGDENFVGNYPFCEPESIALRNFTLSLNPQLTISFHSKGQEIYWEFCQSGYERARDRQIAKSAKQVTGYKIKSTPNSCGGYKDWCVQKLKIPALTVEVGNDALAHPLGKENLEEIYQQNKDLLFAVIKRYMELKCKKNL